MLLGNARPHKNNQNSASGYVTGRPRWIFRVDESVAFIGVSGEQDLRFLGLRGASREPGPRDRKTLEPQWMPLGHGGGRSMAF